VEHESAERLKTYEGGQSMLSQADSAPRLQGFLISQPANIRNAAQLSLLVKYENVLTPR
jgi:hypothetical protein